MADIVQALSPAQAQAARSPSVDYIVQWYFPVTQIRTSQLHFTLKRNVLVALLSLLLSACSVFSPKLLHGFGFDVLPSSGAELLDWRYGSGNEFYLRAYPPDVSRGKIKSSGSVAGFMEVGQSLYVKWKVVESGQILEKTIDLRGKLPNNMTDHDIYFEIDHAQLIVFLKTPVIRGISDPVVGPPQYRRYVVIKLYPVP